MDVSAHVSYNDAMGGDERSITGAITKFYQENVLSSMRNTKYDVHRTCVHLSIYAELESGVLPNTPV